MATAENEKMTRLLRRKRLRHMALMEAAALIENKASAMDLDSGLTPDDEKDVRNRLRDDIPAMLRKQAGEG